MNSQIIVGLAIDTEGTYLLTLKELSGFARNKLFLGVGMAVIVIGVVAYVGVKK